MAALRRVIDEHERSMLQQISAKRTQEKRELEDYKGALARILRECDFQKAGLSILTTDGTKLMQAKADFEVHVKNTNKALQTMQIPRRQYHHIQGIDQLEILKRQIAQCVRYVRCSNPELERRIVNSQGQNYLELQAVCSTSADMEAVAHAVRSNKVSISEFCFAFARHQS